MGDSSQLTLGTLCKQLGPVKLVFSAFVISISVKDNCIFLEDST